MPHLPSISLLLNNLADPNTATNSSNSSLPTNATLQVVCAWPVSGQYGPGSRVLYYVLVIACVVARKSEWLRDACLAAALLFPAVAAAHGIVLAAVHVNGAVDMDVFGAFQLCSIGILAAPVTVKLSQTYLHHRGRNIIFLWTGLILAGLLGLIVEFYRLNTSDCTSTVDDSNHTISHNPAKFPYGKTMCGLNYCTIPGPHSPMRGGSTNNIYVIPAPDKLTFSTATLIAAACCIPAILSLVSMWIKILEMNWKDRFGNRNEDEGRPIEGTNGATVEEMKGVNATIRLWLSALEVPVFGAAILAILLIGEMNFFSAQVKYQTEPIASVGQWAPIVGTGLAALGSLYLLLAKDLEQLKVEANNDISMQHCNCSHHHQDMGQLSVLHSQSGLDYSRSSRDTQSMHGDESLPQDAIGLQEVDRGRSLASSHSHSAALARHSLSNSGEVTSSEMVQISSRPTLDHGHPAQRSWTMETSNKRNDAGNRRKVANALTKVGNYLGSAAHDQLESEFRHGKALDFPEIPGEQHRNPELPQIRERYNQSVTPVPHEHPSRAGSFIGSVASGHGGIERSSTTPRTSSPQPLSSSASPSYRPHANTLPSGRNSFDPHHPPLSPSVSSPGDKPQRRRDTLEVPSPVHRSFTHNTSSASQGGQRG